MKSLAMLLVALVASVCLVPLAEAQTQGLEVNVNVVGHEGIVAGSASDHFLSFSGPVGIPGVGLAPGTYIFRFVAPSVMQVLSEDRSTAYGMFFMTRTWRSEAIDEYAVTLRRVVDDAPARIETMFAPNSLTGYELTHPAASVTSVEQIAMK